MKLKTTSHFDKRLSSKIRKNTSLKNKINKKLKLLVQNVNHPSLDTHKLKGERARERAIWIESNLRIVFLEFNNTILLTDIITHYEY